jgi:hypothetical protein
MRKAIGFVLLALALACGGDKVSGPGSESIAGSYSLTTIDGAALPTVVVQAPDDKLEVTTGSLSLHGDNSYLLTFNLRETQGGTVTVETLSESGAYSRASETVSFHPSDDSGDWSASYASGGTLTATLDGVTFVFGR